MNRRDKLLERVLLGTSDANIYFHSRSTSSEVKQLIKYEVIIYWSEEDQAFVQEWIETANARATDSGAQGMLDLCLSYGRLHFCYSLLKI